MSSVGKEVNRHSFHWPEGDDMECSIWARHILPAAPVLRGRLRGAQLNHVARQGLRVARNVDKPLQMVAPEQRLWQTKYLYNHRTSATSWARRVGGGVEKGGGGIFNLVTIFLCKPRWTAVGPASSIASTNTLKTPGLVVLKNKSRKSLCIRSCCILEASIAPLPRRIFIESPTCLQHFVMETSPGGVHDGHNVTAASGCCVGRRNPRHHGVR